MHRETEMKIMSWKRLVILPGARDTDWKNNQSYGARDKETESKGTFNCQVICKDLSGLDEERCQQQWLCYSGCPRAACSSSQQNCFINIMHLAYYPIFDRAAGLIR